MTTSRGVVWVTPSLSAEARSGGEIRTQRLLTALNQEVPVELVAVGARSSVGALRAATGCATVHTFPIESSGLRKRVRAVRRDWPLKSSGWWHPEAARLVDARSEAGDVLVLDQLWMAGYSASRSGHVLLLHNAEAALLREEPRPRGAVRALEAWWNVSATSRLEARALRQAGLIVAVSEHDAALLKVHTLVVPNGTDLPAAPGPRPAGGDVLFVGSMDHLPNERAVRWWVEEVWPHVGGRVPPLTVVGRGACAALADLAGHPAVRIVGEVDDVGPYLRNAAVVAVPLQHGGGTRLKVLEALAWERPVVSTSKGAEGLPLANRRHALLADDGRGFAEAVCAVYRDEDLAAALAGAGRRFAETFSWDRLVVPFAAAIAARCGAA